MSKFFDEHPIIVNKTEICLVILPICCQLSIFSHLPLNVLIVRVYDTWLQKENSMDVLESNCILSNFFSHSWPCRLHYLAHVVHAHAVYMTCWTTLFVWFTTHRMLHIRSILLLLNMMSPATISIRSIHWHLQCGFYPSTILSVGVGVGKNAGELFFWSPSDIT